MDSAANPEPLSTAGQISNDPPAKWGTAGVSCYCTTGSSDYCEFCDEWVGKCWCWDEENDEDDDGVDDD